MPHPTDPEAGSEQKAEAPAVPLAAAAPAPVKKKRNLPGTPGLCVCVCAPRLLWGWHACYCCRWPAATSAPTRVP
jgi:hypothetical protein